MMNLTLRINRNIPYLSCRYYNVYGFKLNEKPTRKFRKATYPKYMDPNYPKRPLNGIYILK